MTQKKCDRTTWRVLSSFLFDLFKNTWLVTLWGKVLYPEEEGGKVKTSPEVKRPVHPFPLSPLTNFGGLSKELLSSSAFCIGV
jgi:hypothetical protein